MLEFAKELVGVEILENDPKDNDTIEGHEIDIKCLEVFISQGHLKAAEYLIIHHYIPREIGSYSHLPFSMLRYQYYC